MKVRIIIIAVASLLTACNLGKESKASDAEQSPAVSLDRSSQETPPLNVSLKGAIDHEHYTAGQTASVTFSRFPKSVEEFRQVREKLAVEPHGAVALQVMAYEMYRRDREIGLACINLNNTLTNSGEKSSAIRQLKLIFSDDNSSRPYQMATYLSGATHTNGYNPQEPYVVEVTVDAGRGYTESNDYQTTVLHLKVLTSGKNSPDPIAVLKTHKPDETSEGKYFIVSESGSLYSRVREKSFQAEFNGLK
ncbi:DUF6935 domain-containing protein [Porphyromonas gulae]|uniref:DUF6935 domain-containing protein n=1 Tax=Porphyromonas gulae TaxID=111105 RepID=UPI000618832C|nr:hypothetical protein [Porphyromonas gulae]